MQKLISNSKDLAEYLKASNKACKNKFFHRKFHDKFINWNPWVYIVVTMIIILGIPISLIKLLELLVKLIMVIK